MNRPIGVFMNNDGIKVNVIQMRGESKEDAIKRVTEKHGKTPEDVRPLGTFTEKIIKKGKK